MLIFLVFEVSVYYYFGDASTDAKKSSSSSSTTTAAAAKEDESEPDMNVNDLNPAVNDMLCTREMFKVAQTNGTNCVCITDDETLVAQRFDLRQLTEYIRHHRKEGFACAMTVDPNGRLGNLMGEYATLYALAKMNGRPAFLPPGMAKTLRAYFRISMPSMAASDFEQLDYLWTNVEVRRWMEPSYAHLSEMFIRIMGPPYSWTFYEDLQAEIAREFAFHNSIQREVDEQLRKIASSRSTVTLVGVHARRTDAIGWIENYHGRVADKTYFAKAMDHFRRKYSDAVFVVVSDDMAWCRRNIDTTHDDVHFAGEGNVNSPIHDFALLANCNHSIISIGTYGYWTAFLARGDTVYLTNYTNPNSHYLKKFSYETMYLPHWKGIS